MRNLAKIAVFGYLLLLSTAVFAQQQQGSIFGTVSDESGALIPGAVVEASGPALIRALQVVTDDTGTYRFPTLPPGIYTITCSLQGFATFRNERIELNVGRTIKADITLKVSQLAETITVTSASVVDVVKSESAQVLNKEVTDWLPKARDYQSIVKINPGINVEKTGINIDGSSGSENVFVVDGIDTTDMYSGTTRQEVPFEFIEEVQVKTGGYEAEYGGAMGGVISVVTKSGSNEFHGEGVYYLDSDKLRGGNRDRLRINPVDDVSAEYLKGEPEDPFDRHEFGFSLGGYVIKDRLWFFGSYLPKLENLSRQVTFLSDNSTRTFNRDQTTHNATVKLSTVFFDNLNLSGSFNNNWFKTLGEIPGRDGTANPDDNWAEKGSREPAYTLSTNVDYLITPKIVLSGKAGYFYSDNVQLGGPDTHRWRMVGNISQFSPPADLLVPSGYSNISSGYVRVKSIRDRKNAYTDASFFFNAGGEHNFKLGYQFNRIHNDVNNTYKNDYMMFYWGRTYHSSFSNQDFKGKYGYLRLVAGPENPYGEKAEVGSNRHAIFIQDAWRPVRDLTINAGLRFEKEDIPSFSDLPEFLGTAIAFGFGDKIAPRIGASYDVFGDSRFKIFGSWGLFYDVMKLELANGSFGGFKWKDRYYTLESLDWKSFGAGQYTLGGGQFIEEINWRIPSFDTLDPDLDAMRMQEFIGGGEYRFGDDYVFSARFVHKQLDRAIEDVGIPTSHGEQYFITNPGFGYSITKMQENGYPATPKAKRDYNALELGLNKRFSANWRGRLTYTYSRLRGLYSGLASSDEEGRQSPNVDRDFDLWFLSYDSQMRVIDGPLQTDRPHQFKIDGNYQFPWGLSLGVFQQFLSGRPITRTVDINNVDVIVDNRASDGRMPWFLQTDLYTAYSYRISEEKSVQVNFNIVNLFDQARVDDVYRLMIRQNMNLDLVPGQPYDYKAEINSRAASDPYFKDPRFLKPNGFQDSIVVRMGLRFIF